MLLSRHECFQQAASESQVASILSAPDLTQPQCVCESLLEGSGWLCRVEHISNWTAPGQALTVQQGTLVRLMQPGQQLPPEAMLPLQSHKAGQVRTARIAHHLTQLPQY